MKKQFIVLRTPLYEESEALAFAEMLSIRTDEGYEVTACGINSDGFRTAWAILSRPAEEQKPERKWISVDERKPAKGVNVFVRIYDPMDDEVEYGVAALCNKGWVLAATGDVLDDMYNVSHWMPTFEPEEV